jgi:hypothetical protein
MTIKTIYFYISEPTNLENYLIKIKQQKNIQKIICINITYQNSYDFFNEDIEETNEYLESNESIINPSLNNTDDFIYKYIHNHNTGNSVTKETKKGIQTLLRNNIYKIQITYKS